METLGVSQNATDTEGLTAQVHPDLTWGFLRTLQRHRFSRGAFLLALSHLLEEATVKS